MMMIAIGALVLAVLYLYRENQKLRKPVVVDLPEPAEVPAPKKKVTFEEKIAEKSVPTESE
jgi:hypothetical protein